MVLHEGLRGSLVAQDREERELLVLVVLANGRRQELVRRARGFELSFGNVTRGASHRAGGGFQLLQLAERVLMLVFESLDRIDHLSPLLVLAPWSVARVARSVFLPVQVYT
ncbi:MAG: hypothetical protein V3W32_09165 [Gemmatimonadota bacterium]